MRPYEEISTSNSVINNDSYNSVDHDASTKNHSHESVTSVWNNSYFFSEVCWSALWISALLHLSIQSLILQLTSRYWECVSMIIDVQHTEFIYANILSFLWYCSDNSSLLVSDFTHKLKPTFSIQGLHITISDEITSSGILLVVQSHPDLLNILMIACLFFHYFLVFSENLTLH